MGTGRVIARGTEIKTNPRNGSSHHTAKAEGQLYESMLGEGSSRLLPIRAV